jgi:hypothetical protein
VWTLRRGRRRGPSDRAARDVPVTEILLMIEAQRQVTSIVDTVMERSHARWDIRLVRDLANEYVAEFEAAPVQDFVDVLVIKEVTDELRRLDEAQMP